MEEIGGEGGMKRGRKDDLLTMAILVSWTSSYWVCAASKPDIIANWPPSISAFFLSVFGAFLMSGVIIELAGNLDFAGVIYVICAVFEIVGFVNSWVGNIAWRVSAGVCVPEYQISMAVFDWVAAITLLYRMGRCWEDSIFREVDP